MSNVCLICGDIINNEYDNVNIKESNMSQIKLKCGHYFHYYCIYTSYKYTGNKKCPYCRCEGGDLCINKSTINAKISCKYWIRMN